MKCRLSTVYYLLALLALFTTGYYNTQYILTGGSLSPQAFFGTAFANVLTTAITLDVYLAALVFSLWLVNDAKRSAVKWPWLYVVLCFGVGLAVALPLYLARREATDTESCV